MAPDAHMKKSVVIPDDAYFHFSWMIPLAGSLLFAVPLGPMGAILWLAIYFAWGFRIIQNKDYVVIERFGEFSRIVHSGPRLLCLPGLIDSIVTNGTLRYQEKALFADDVEKYHVDFKDGSTPVVMKASYRVGPQGNSLKDLNNAIYLFTYTIQNEKEREERIEEILESVAVQQLQALDISAALVERDTIAKSVTADPEVRRALAAMGVELNEEKGLLIPDIALTPEIIAQREKKLQGTSEAEKQRAQGFGYARSIKAIMEELGVTQEEARSVYETQRGLEVLGSLEANVSFVAPDMKGVQKTMGVGDANPRNNQHKERKVTS